MRVVGGCVVAVVMMWATGCDAPTPAEPTTTSFPVAACEVERRTIETANEAHKATYGSYVESLDRLVGEWLKGPPEFEWTYSTTGDTFTMTGPC